MSDDEPAFSAFELIKLALQVPSFVISLRKFVPCFSSDSNNGTPAKVLVIGAGGVGKTTLAKVLTCAFDTQTEKTNTLRESIVVEKENDDILNRHFIVLPGQVWRREESWPEYLNQLKDDEISGVIVVNAGGLHEIRGSYKLENTYQDGLSKNAFLNKFKPAMQAKEFEVLNVIESAIKHRSSKLWMLSLVLKQDLWESTKQNVENWYIGDGDYAAKISELRNSYPKLKIESVFGSLVLSNFTDGDGVMLAKTVAGFEQSKAVDTYHRILDTLTQLAAWRDEK